MFQKNNQELHVAKLKLANFKYTKLSSKNKIISNNFKS